MGWRFRRSVRILPGIHVNVGKRGLSSVSFGRRGLHLTVGRTGTRETIGLPGTGLSYTAHQPPPAPSPPATDEPSSVVVVSWLLVGAFVVAIALALVVWSHN